MGLTYQQAVEQTITGAEQFHQIINGTSTTEVVVEDGSSIPSVRKALIDNFYFKDPVAWQNGASETVFNQIRSFTDGTWWFAPAATTVNPVPMNTTPIGDINWKLLSWDRIIDSQKANKQLLTRSYAEAGYSISAGSFQEGAVINSPTDAVVLYGTTINVYVWKGTLPKVIPQGSTPVSTGGLGPSAWVSVSSELLRTQLTTYGSDLISGVQVSRKTLSLAKAKTDYEVGEVVYITDLGYSFKFNPSRYLINSQPSSEITFDDELHILVTSGGMLEFCDWQKIGQLETQNYAKYQSKLRGRSLAISIDAIGDSTTFCQALPSTVGATDKNGVATNFGDGSTYANWQYNNHWPKILGDILNNASLAGASVSNLGYSGDRALTGYLRHRVVTSSDVSVVMYGINDVLYGTSNGANPDQIYSNGLYSLSNYQNIMRKTIAREILRGKSVIVLGTTVFGSLVGWDGTNYSANRLTESYDTVAKSVANEFGCVYVDTKTEILRQYKLSDILQEGTHLNEAGCKVIAGKLAAVVLGRWKTPNKINAGSSVLSNPNITDMIGKGQNGVLPNSTSNSPAFQSNDPTTILITSTQPVFYPIYAEEDSLIVFPEMIGSAAGASVTFRINGGAISPPKLNPRDLGTTPSSGKVINLTGTHIDETNQNYSSDAFFVSLVSKGWHLLEVSKDSGTGGVLLDGFTVYSEYTIKDKHTKGLTAKGNKSNSNTMNLTSTSAGTGLFNLVFSTPMTNTDYQTAVEQITGNTAQCYKIASKTINGFSIQFMSGAGTGVGIAWNLQDPSDFSVRVYGGR